MGIGILGQVPRSDRTEHDPNPHPNPNPPSSDSAHPAESADSDDSEEEDSSDEEGMDPAAEAETRERREDMRRERRRGYRHRQEYAMGIQRKIKSQIQSGVTPSPYANKSLWVRAPEKFFVLMEGGGPEKLFVPDLLVVIPHFLRWMWTGDAMLKCPTKGCDGKFQTPHGKHRAIS